jgi:secreted trypsin-like serine protease
MMHMFPSNYRRRAGRPKAVNAPGRKRQWKLECLEARLAPVVGANAIPAAVARGAGFDGVVQLFHPNNTTCTGTLMTTGRHILTAAHCVADGSGTILPGNHSLTFEMPTGDITITVPFDASVQAIASNPGFDGDTGNGNDVALMVLPDQDNLTVPNRQMIAPLGAERFGLFTANTEVGQNFTVVGYGRTGTGTTGNQMGTGGTKRLGMNRWDSSQTQTTLGNAPQSSTMPADGTALAYDFDNGMAANDAFGAGYGINDLGLGANEACQAPGDSGGPAFLGNLISGIVSFSRQRYASPPDIDAVGNNTFGEFAVMTRVSAFLPYINTSVATLNAAANQYHLVLDMDFQPGGNDGTADTIVVSRDGASLRVSVNGVLDPSSYTLADLLSFTVRGSGDDDTVIFNDDLGVSVVVDGEGGNNTLQDGGAAAHTWNVDGPNSGNVSFASSFQFSDVQNLVGSSAGDTFNFQAGGSIGSNASGAGGDDRFVFQGGTVGGDVDGGAGSDTLDFAATTSQEVRLNSLGAVDGFSGLTVAVVPIGGQFFNMNAVVGSAAGTTDRLLGNFSNSRWTISGGNDGVFLDLDANRTFDFTDVENLTGRDLDDTFVFQDGSSLGGDIDGGGGTNDRLDYTAFNNLSFQLTGLGAIDGFDGNDGTGPLGGAFRNMNGLSAGPGADDTLAGADLVSTWRVTGDNAGAVEDAGSARTFAFTGVENLTGGGLADRFVFESTGSIGGDFDGRGGRDVMDFSATTPQETRLNSLGAVDGFSGFTVSFFPIGGLFFNMDAVVGSAAGTTDNLVGRSATALWVVSGVNAGQYFDSGRSFDFSSVENLTGRDGEDTFILNAGTQITGRIAGGAGGGDVLRGQGAAGVDTMVLTPGRLTFNALATLFESVEAVQMLGEGGNDRFTVRFNQGNPVPVNGLAVVGGTGTDDRLTTIGSALADGMVLTPSFLKVNAAAPVSYALLEQMDLFAGGGNDVFNAGFINYQAALAGVRFFGQQGNDTIRLAPSATTRFFIHGGPPARPTFPGDALFFIKTGQLIQPPVILGNGGSDGLFRFKNRMAVQFASIEQGVGGNLDIQPWNDFVPNIF